MFIVIAVNCNVVSNWQRKLKTNTFIFVYVVVKTFVLHATIEVMCTY